MKKIIPASIKLFLKLLLRKVNDLRKGYKRKFALTFSGENNFIEVLCIQQPIKPTPSSINKQHNIQLAAKKMNGLLIEPGQIFSFWKLAGSPAEKNGYQKSRTIIKGEIDVTVGGGLCQLSGLIYYMALQAGLKIIERYAHSIDIYTEEERFTPLGSDATVVYGYKDLRFENNFSFPIMLQFTIEENVLKGFLFSAEKISLHNISFAYEYKQDSITVKTLQRDSENFTEINSSTYRKL